MKTYIGKISILLIFYTFLGCVKPGYPDSDYFTAWYDMHDLPVSDAFEGITEMGLLTNAEIDEASGLAVSRQNPDLLWTHNDRGDMNRIFLLHNTGSWLGTFRLPGAENRDWEDMAIGPGPVDGVVYLYVADIGDNRAEYPVKYIYRFPEPDVNLADTTVQWVDVSGVERIAFVYPDNRLMDAETLLADPWTKDLYVITKREFPVTVYRLPYPQSTTGVTTAIKYGTLPFTWATAGDISADGFEIVLKNLERVFLWTRQEGESLRDAFMRPPQRLRYAPEMQGEAIAFAPDGSGFYTLSESVDGVAPPIFFYPRKMDD